MPRRTQTIAPALPASGALRPLGLDEVRITGGFWADRVDTNRDATLPHILHWLEREGWLPNFDLAAAGTLPEGRRGREFADSEIYKFLEAAAWSLGTSPSAALEATFGSVVARVAAAQEADGYLNTYFGRPGQPPRWSELGFGHELYCLGHLFQAAVARARTRPDETDGLLSVATRAADLVCAVFGDGGNDGVCGHAEVETALAELARVTGDDRYARQAELFVERRGHGRLTPNEFGAAYFQDDLPVRATTTLHGHAVRANYLAAGAVDVAVETGDAALLDSLVTQWRTAVARRTYITGGQGAHHQDEAFGLDWELPPDRAYSETCAGIGSIQFSWRLLLATGEPQYADLIERTLFNVVATSPSAEGTAFYYSNTLHQREEGRPADPDVPSARASASLRAPWFEVSCCPPNVARTLASLPAYLATVSESGLQLHQYAASTIRTALPSGEAIDLAVEADYPASGVIRVVVGRDAAQEWTLSLRIPSWGAGATVSVRSGGSVESSSPGPGVAAVTRRFLAGDVVELTLPVAPRVTHPDPRIDAVRGCVAIERGPEVLCLESVDLPAGLAGRSVDDVRLASAAVTPDLTVALRVHDDDDDDGWPYGPERPRASTAGTARLVPYHSWANRGPSTMRIWLPVAE
ncbi:glycoside hydrolase family 127 protein [uncultured Amnibacterium sp.]|uniref:glycoside hydrolase family 127 protein n=1 Tax=uncultured Amnibacterium sp. TaxID=1631851 RepID=UPI0035CB88DE